MTILLTRHAQDRMKARTNYSPSAAQQKAEEAYWCGKNPDDFPKELAKYLNNVLQSSKDEGKGNELRVLGKDVYLFGNGYLITVFPLPEKIIRKINKPLKRH